MIASEDSTVGASQKGVAFKSKMHTEYVSLLTNQHSYECSLLGTASSAITRDGYAQSGITFQEICPSIRVHGMQRIFGA